MPTPDAVVRVKDDQAPVSVFVYELLSSVVLSPGKAFHPDHPVVKQAPWAFGLDTVEDASATPGAKRSVKRQTSTDA